MPDPAAVDLVLSDAELDRIVAAVKAAATPPSIPAPTPSADGDHPLRKPLQRSIRKLQADILRRSEQATSRSKPPERPSPAGWHVLSTGTSRASAPLVDALSRIEAAALAACDLPAPITVRFGYRWVRAQYAVDDHGALSATADRADGACITDRLTQAGILGRHDYGKRPWTLEARYTPSQ